ncbi:CMP-N-acetylneuraminate-beta-galactosamide-alpha-2,3-sialyltransferase 1-like [Trichomycterus rosablanca]|uniref:CMP-N-acetylneuraminate-beta-galactosamide- alpha-2,3-sialyltransferase 1-like n=1 Tax=Trichomycterus rosablanca TaxID=2290929 RepID=UPI002F352AD6
MAWLRCKKVHTLITLFCLVTLFCLIMYLLKHPFFLRGPSLNATTAPCGCQRCILDQKGDSWFGERFNQSIHPLMSRSNSELSNDTYRWWLLLQDETNPASLSMVLDKLFKIIPGDERYMDAGPSRCRSCSVVGNSGNLRSSNYGSLIDSSEFVIRINQAPTRGFEQDVGYRTTHHVMYPESAIDLPNPKVSLLLIPFKTLDLEWLTSTFTTAHINYTYMPVPTRIKANRNNVLLYNPAFMKYVHESWMENHGQYPSTGFLTIVLALHICDQVNVFGFGANQNGDWHHYWEEEELNSAFKETFVHHAVYEHDLTQKLYQQGKITFYKGVQASSVKAPPETQTFG